MEYKILLVRNRYTKKLDFKKGLEWFKNNTPLDVVVIEEIKTDFEVSLVKPISNGTYDVTVWGDDLFDKLKTVVPEGKYHCVVIVMGNKIAGIRPFGYASTQPLYPGTDLIQLFKLNNKGKTLNHEIFHTFFNRLHRQQILVEDPMDTYLNDGSLDAKPSNRTMALARLSPYWEKVTNITTFKDLVEITRESDNKIQTTGTLIARKNGILFQCKTLELPWKNNAENISSIPKGTYEVKWTFSPRFLRYTYELQKVPARTGIRFHVANYYRQLNGCIALGDNLVDIDHDGQMDTTSSKITISKFEAFMDKKPFTLTIK